jgi:RNA-directed DNA polymerase
VNGPEGPRPVFDGDAWEQVDWRDHEERVRRLRCRIFKAVQDGDLATVRNLQRLMLRSWSNTLVSVRQVTQRNTGRKTAGIDGQVGGTSGLVHLLPARHVRTHLLLPQRLPLGPSHSVAAT